MGALEKQVVELVAQMVGVTPERREFPWLVNRHTLEHCLGMYDALEAIFTALKGDHDGLQQKGQVSLPADAYFPGPCQFLLEVDELQHFTPYKAAALEAYPDDARLGFDQGEYLRLCHRYGSDALKKGQRGYRSPKSEFPFDYGRAAQRAYFDAFRDLLAPLHGLRPTLRIPLPDDEVSTTDVRQRVTEYLRRWAAETACREERSREAARVFPMAAGDGSEARHDVVNSEAAAGKSDCLWSRVEALAGAEVQLLGPSGGHIRVLSVGQRALMVRKSNGSERSIERHLIEDVAREVRRRGRMTRDEVLDHIGQYHSSSICALLVATRLFRCMTNPITLLPAGES